MFVHFEMVPDRLPEVLMELLERFPAGGVQLEVGIQTFDESVARNISRRQNYGKLEENLRRLRARTGVHIHADLIAGLPGESLESFGRGFDRLLELAPQEIQVGVLKRLRGTPITRHDKEWEMKYGGHPPYEILQNRSWSFIDMQRIRRFARFWDLYANSGRFVHSLPLLWAQGESPFSQFMSLSDWLAKRFGRTHSLPLVALAEGLHAFLSQELEKDGVEAALRADWCGDGVRRERLPFLESAPHKQAKRGEVPSQARRQSRHLAASMPRSLGEESPGGAGPGQE